MPNIYVLIPLLACLGSALSALAILLRDPSHPGNRVAAALIGGAAHWALCQALWTLATDGETAWRLLQVASMGWSWIGPLSLHLASAVVMGPPRWVRRALPALYATGAFFALLQLASPWMIHTAVPEPWGWGFRTGPVYPVFLAFTLGCVFTAIAIALQAVLDAPSPAERRQVRVIAAGVAAPLIFATLSSALLPIFDIQVPRLGSASFTVLGVTIAFSYYRYGFSAFVPGSFSREILETLPDGVALVALNGVVRSANDVMARLLGLPSERLLGVRVDAYLSRPIATPATDLREVECELATASERIPVAVSTSCLRDKQGQPIGTVLVVRDLREVVSLRNRLVTSGRLAAVGQLAAGIAHEINNPTAYVRANLTQLRAAWAALAKRLPSGEEDPELQRLLSDGEELIDESLEGVERTAAIVRDVRGFAHRGQSAPEPVDLNEVLRDVLRIAQPELRDRVRVELHAGSIACVSGVAQELKQVFLNLIMNANQAIAETGTIRVATSQEDGRVSVRVEDDGCGISPEDQGRIFDPFFTTKPVGEGVGLGLAITHEIVRNHGAELLVDSELGRGTALTVRFRALDPPA